MESDICGEKVSPALVNRTEKTVVEDDSRSLLEEGSDKTESQSSEHVITASQADTQSDIKPQHDHDSLNDDQSDNDYYEVISADGSIGDLSDIHNDEESLNFDPSNKGCADTEDKSLGETVSFNDLPFVPKFEFPPDQNENQNVSNYGVLRINKLISNNIPRPDKNFTIPPPNFKPLDIKPSLDFIYPALNHNFQDPTSSKHENIISTVSENLSKNDTSHSRYQIKEALRSLPGSSKEKSHVVDWLDENGDPVPGAFDYVKPEEEEPDFNKSSKVEYVFSVREKKDVPVKSEPSDVVNSGFLINQNVLHKNVAGNLGVLLENQLVKDPTRIFQDDEEKKLYEASKSGAEYKAAVGAVTASSSTTDTPATVSKVVPENDNPKKERFPRFRRNRFTDIKKEDESKPEETSEENPKKSTEEVALERQAVTEILKEVQRGAARAREHGALGWQKCPVPVTNKTFLRNTLVSTLREPYRPPSKRGRFHVGLKKEDAGKDHGKREYDNDSHSSRSSRSRSHSSSRSCSSYSGSSFTDDERARSRDRQGHFPRGGGRGSWPRGHHQYYDEAWAAYNAHYGYPWYGPEPLPMFYGPEGWPPMDPYAAMYYGDPQAWMEYEAYYGPPNFNSRGPGRGFRGRGRGDRGRGRGGYDGDFRDYNEGFQSHREFSPPRSRSGLSRSWSRDRSRSRSRIKSGDSRSRSRSHSLSRSHTHSQSKSRRRSRDRSLDSKSDGKIRSDTEINGKKKKKKKKKKKHKKSKKSKHKQKDEEKNKGAEEIVENDTETDKINNEHNKDRKEENSKNCGKEDDTLKQKKEKESYKHKNKGKSKKEIKDVDENIEKKDGSKVSGNVTDIRDIVNRKSEHKDKDVEECSTQKINRQPINVIEVKRRAANKNKEGTKENADLIERNRSDSQDSRKRRVNDNRIEDARKQQDITEKDRSENQDSRKRRLNDKKVEDVRKQQDIRERGENQDSRKRMKISDPSGRDGRVETADIMGVGESQDSRKGIRIIGHRVPDGRVSMADLSGRDGRAESQDSRKRISGHRVQDRLGTAELSGRDAGAESQDSRKRISGHRVQDRLGTAELSGRDAGAESQDSRKRISGHRVQDRLGTAELSERDGKGKNQDGRKGFRVTDHGDGGVGMVDVSDMRSENLDNRKRIGDNRNKNERDVITNITERVVRRESYDRRDTGGTDNPKFKPGINITETERSDSRSRREGGRKDGEKRGRGITEREGSESHDSMDESRKDCDKHERNIKYKKKDGSHCIERERKSKSNDSREITKKDSQKNRERSERSQITENDSINEGAGIKQRIVTSHTTNKEKDGSIEGAKKIHDCKEGNIFGTVQKSLQTDNKRERSSDKKTVGIRSGTKDKRRRSDSSDSDENVDRKLTGKMICGSVTSIYGQTESRDDRNKTEERYKESRSGNEREFSQAKINKVNKGSMRNYENQAADKEMKGCSLEKQSEQKYESGGSGTDRKAFQCVHKDSKERSHRDNQDFESEQYDREKCKDGSNPEKLEHKKVVRSVRPDNENDKAIKAKSLDFANESNTNVDVTRTKIHSTRINSAMSESKDMTENKPKGVKRGKKMVQKQEAKKMKPSESGETIGSHYLVSESSGEIRKKKLKPRKKLKEGPQEGKKSNETTMD